ncbi:MAG: gas vesicle protein [Acidobacteria bacterium]|nr:gas vesicle protein [Acidobacteriota bacterium]
MADELSRQTAHPDILEQSDLSLLETLDHVLNRGIVIAGEITISVADVDLIFLGLNVLLTSTETARDVLNRRAGAAATEHGGDD